MKWKEESFEDTNAQAKAEGDQLKTVSIHIQNSILWMRTIEVMFGWRWNISWKYKTARPFQNVWRGNKIMWILKKTNEGENKSVVKLIKLRETIS